MPLEELSREESDSLVAFARNSFTALPLYDRVKLDFFEHYVRVRSLYEQCLSRKMKNFNKNFEYEFIAGVVSLSFDIRPKVDYLADPTEKGLYSSLTIMGSRDLSMSFESAEQAFILERQFLEANGITRYEFRNAPLSEYTIKGAGRK